MTTAFGPVLALLAAYLLGSIPFGLIIAKSRGIDIRQHGSGNIGATNVWRTLGRRWGLLTFFCDAAKGWLAVTGALYLAERIQSPYTGLIGILAALGCILGHNFPVWLGFKGGKGVATSLGVIIGLMPLASVIVFAIWGVVFKLTRYVSLASIVGAVALPLIVLALGFLGPDPGRVNLYFSIAAAALVVYGHRANIARLRQGTENRAGKK